jgi:hypothetical protein
VKCSLTARELYMDTTLVEFETVRTWEEMLAIREILKDATQCPRYSHAERAAAIAMLGDIDEELHTYDPPRW